MINTPEQFVQIQKSTFEMLQAVALKSVEGVERLAELNIQAVKASLAESNEQMSAVLAAKDPKAIADMAMAGAQPGTDKVTAYAKHVYEISNETGTEIAKLFEKQFAESNKQWSAAMEAMAKDAPAGTEGVVTFVQQAMSAANSAYDQVNKVTKQAVEMAEANVAAATKAGRAGSKKAA
jgi:phasin family protein